MSTSPTTSPPTQRFLLWVDGVGGYLVCTQQEVRIGQAIAGTEVEIALRCELARHHATLKRLPEGYVLVPTLEALDQSQTIFIADKPLQSAHHLTDGETIQLGTQVKLRFRKPHALSHSARLDFLTPHRTHPYADGILLLAESCILGPKAQSHVVCPEWNDDVILVRQQEQLFCKSTKSVKVDGQAQTGRVLLSPSSQVSGQDFSFALEPLDLTTAGR